VAADIIVPKMGLTETHATVVRWRKAVGDEVSAGDVVVEIQADKADVDIEAAADGVIVEILVEEGVEVELGTVIGRIGAVGAVGAVGAAAGAGTAAGGPDGPTVESALSAGADDAPVATVMAVASGASLAPGARVPSSPLARRVAAELGVALAGLAGTGPGGLVVARDIRAAAEVTTVAAAPTAGAPATPAPAAPAAPPVSPPPATVPPSLAAPPAEGPPELPGVGVLRELELSRVRRVTARRLVAAAAVPTVTLHRRAGIEQARVAVAVARAQGVRATLTHAVLAACAQALAKHPELNGFWIDDRLYTAEQVNLGIAVDVEQGLLLAVVEDCAGKGIAELAAASNHAVAEVRQGRGGRGAHATFTVSNLGMLGVELFTPVLNPPETGILGVGAVVDGRIGLSLTFDHRAIDGAPAARFLDLVARELAGV
jgi:pyruvate dehydrogenase E2 component (dihydrolipoamide acetyltransferase)